MCTQKFLKNMKQKRNRFGYYASHFQFSRGINEKTISIRVSVLRNYCPIFYGSSGLGGN